MALVSAVSQYISQRYEWELSYSFSTGMRAYLFEILFSQKPSAYVKRSEGEYLSIINNNVNAISIDYLDPVVDIIKSLIQIVIYAVILFLFIDFRIALAILGTSILAILIPRLVSGKLAQRRKLYLDKLASYTYQLKDYLASFTSLDRKSKRSIIDHHEERVEEAEEAKRSFGFFKTLVNITNGGLMDFISLVAFFLVGYLYIQGEITIGTAIATFGYIESFIYPIKYIINDINSINSSKEVFDELEGFIAATKREEKRDLPAAPLDQLSLEKASAIQGDFRLNEFSSSFRKGKSYALVGPSGRGKSTVANIIKGLVPTVDGVILVNGQDYTAYIDEYSDEKMILVRQHTQVFEDDYRNNVTNFGTYAEPDLDTYENVVSTNVLERIVTTTDAKKLSGGEKQILNIIKALNTDAELVVFDEAFSAIDKQNQEGVKKLVDKELDDRIYIEITHDLSEDNLARFDEVIYM